MGKLVPQHCLPQYLSLVWIKNLNDTDYTENESVQQRHALLILDRSYKWRVITYLPFHLIKVSSSLLLFQSDAAEYNETQTVTVITVDIVRFIVPLT